MNLAGMRSTAVFIPAVPLLSTSLLVTSDSAADDVTMPSMQYGSLNPDPQNNVSALLTTTETTCISLSVCAALQ